MSVPPAASPSPPEEHGGLTGPPAAGTRSNWTFLTNHGHVLLAVAEDPEIRVADIAARVGITTRAALQILRDLESGGYLHRTRVGRRTQYKIEPHQHFRHRAIAGREIDGLIALFSAPAADVHEERT